MKKKVILYNRVSTPSQSIESQVNKLEEYCKNKNYHIHQRFDEQISGNSELENRTAMNDLLTYCTKHQNEIFAVVVWDISRLARRLSIALTIVEKLSEIKITVINSSRDTSTLNEDGILTDSNELIYSIDSIIASQERKRIRDNMKRGKDNKIKNHNYADYGKFLPYGYKSIDKILKIDDTESKIIELIFKLYLLGFGSKLIASFLNGGKIDTKKNSFISGVITELLSFYQKLKIEDNELIVDTYTIYLKKKIPTRYSIVGDSVYFKKSKNRKEASDFLFRDKTILGILKNPLYMGKRKYKEMTINSPAIISENIFYQTEKILKGKRIKFNRKTKYNYIINNRKVICSVCGNNVYAIRRENRSDNRFSCYSSRVGKSCGMSGIGINILTNSVFYFLSDKEEIINHIKGATDIKTLKDEISYLRERIKDIKTNLLATKIKIQELNRRAIKYKMNDDEFEPIYIDLKKDEESNVEQQSEYLNQIINIEERIKTKERFPSIIKEISNSLSNSKQIFDNFVEKIIIYPSKNNPISSIKNDRAIFVELYIKETSNPIEFLIAQRSKNILILDGQFDKKTFRLKRNFKIIKQPNEIDFKTLNIIDLTSLNSHREVKLSAMNFIIKPKINKTNFAIMVRQFIEVKDGYN